jgi:hypothetical protein
VWGNAFRAADVWLRSVSVGERTKPIDVIITAVVSEVEDMHDTMNHDLPFSIDAVAELPGTSVHCCHTSVSNPTEPGTSPGILLLFIDKKTFDAMKKS